MGRMPFRGREILHTDLRNAHYLQWIQFLKDSENWSTEQIEDYQLTQLKWMVNSAYQNSRGYHKLYDLAGIHPESLKTMDDFKQFPFITKETIRDNLEDFSINVRGREYITTGGSTGIPTGFYRDKIAFAKELASKAHQYYRIGWKEGDRQRVLRGLSIKSKNHMLSYPKYNELGCSSYFLSPEFMRIYYEKALQYSPDWIRCYTSTGYIFARFIKDNRLTFPRLKGILCAFKNLYDFQKDLLHETLECLVFSHYGHYEMAALTGFCELEDTYHVQYPATLIAT